MNPKLLGDITVADRELAEHLLAMEYLANQDAMVPEFKAKIYTCLAHDWLMMDMEEKGLELLKLAETVCPGYYENYQKHQMDKDPQYEKLVVSLTRLLIETSELSVIS